MFLDLFKKESKENIKIQELEQTIQELAAEVDKLKRDASSEEKQTERVVEKKDTPVLPKETAKGHGGIKNNSVSSTTKNKLPLPDILAPRLPADSLIVITSYGNEVQSYGDRLRIGIDHTFLDEPYIQYNVKYLRRDSNEVFENSFHPFILKHTSNLSGCSQNMLKHFYYEPFSYEVTQNVLRVSFSSGYYDSRYEETHKYIMYKESYHESYHDGGGSGDREWYLYDAPGKTAVQELSHERYLGWCTIPECKGYWFEDDHLYLAEPWGMTGIFEFYYCSIECRDYDSDEECRKIGVKYSDNEKNY